MAVGIVRDDGCLLAEEREPTDLSRGPSGICDHLVAMLRRCLDRAPAPGVVGVGCGGPLNRAEGTIVTVPNMPGWDGYPVRGHFEERLHLPVVLDNDATAAGLGEAWFGAGRSRRHVCYFTVSTGIGGGIVIDGRPFRGATGNAAEFGHQVIVPDGPPCTCGRNGCLESLASGTSIARRARERLDEGVSSVLRAGIDGSQASVSAETVAQAARHGDRLACDLWEETGYYLGLGVVNVIQIMNPSIVVIGGGVSMAGSLLFEPLLRTVRSHGMPALVDSCDIVPAKLGPGVGIVGAAALAFLEFEKDPHDGDR